uniref:Pentraxin (PTX) domain-containing protein n=1 Tax=Salmo trutta TaxID=8032 RepID=A0A674B6M5_SALTR
ISDIVLLLSFSTILSLFAPCIPRSCRGLSMEAFTLCMRLATELATGSREIILFAYCTEYYDKLNVWRKADGTYGLCMSVDGTHLCLTRESMSGMVMFYIDGKSSIRKVYKLERSTSCRYSHPGTGPRLLKEVDTKQSFVGGIIDVNMCDYVHSNVMMEALCAGKRVPKQNIFDREIKEQREHQGDH